jgi:YD repeat-containing protein
MFANQKVAIKTGLFSVRGSLPWWLRCLALLPSVRLAGLWFCWLALTGGGLETCHAAPSLVYTNDFSVSAVAEWQPVKVATSSSGDQYWGRFGESRSCTLSLKDLPPHDQIQITFDLYLFESWDGNSTPYGPDIWGCRIVGGPSLIETTFSSCEGDSRQAYPGGHPGGDHPARTGASFTNTLSRCDLTYRLRFAVGHTNSSVTFEFYGSNLQVVEDESWGIDNVAVVATYPPPLIGKGLPGLALVPAGETFHWRPDVKGQPPLRFQWLLEGASLPDQTNSALSVPPSAIADGQHYSLFVTNNFGSATNEPVAIRIVSRLGDEDGDGLLNVSEYQIGTSLELSDTDGDILNDSEEVFRYGTNPLKSDTDDDGMPDRWELSNGLNPRISDGAEDLDRDGLTNFQEYELWLSNHVQRPDRVDSVGDGRNDYEQFTGGQANRFYYDKNDRLVGVEYSAGIAIAYTYDGNDNLRRQTVLSRANDTDRLPVLWRFLNGLTNHSSAFVDTDGDLWTDYQEWKAGTDPRSATSIPALLSNPGSNIASLTLPFIPTNFVVGVGQLDGLGSEEIVIGGDGDPGTNTNFLLVLTHGPTSWSTQRVDVGPFGITSIAVGQPANRPVAGIYVGLRGTNSVSQVMEITSSGGNWQSHVVGISTNEPARVGGIRNGGDLLANLATNYLAGALWSLTFSNSAWNAALVSSNASHLGIPGRGTVFSHSPRQAELRLLDSGEVEVIAGNTEFYKDELLLPAAVIQNPATGNWHFKTPEALSWYAASNFFAGLHGSLTLPGSEPENAWIASHFPEEAWIGLYWLLGENQSYFPFYASGSPAPIRNNFGVFAGYANWIDGRPLFRPEYRPPCTVINTGQAGKWWVRSANQLLPGIGYVSDPVSVFTNRWQIPSPPAISRIVWPGYQVRAGQPRWGGEKQSSIFHSFIDDRNASASVDAGDVFVFAEYQVSDNTVTTATLTNISVGSGVLSQSYGLAVVNYLNSGTDRVFTAEPSGGIYAWSTSTASSPLQRERFSENYLGKAWHALAGVRLAAGGEGLAGLLVDTASANVCNVIFWPPRSAPEASALSTFETAPAAVVLPGTNALGSVAEISVRLWDAEGNASTPSLQFQLPGGTNWTNATLTKVDRQPYTDGLRVAALPEGTDHTLTWNVAAALGSNVTTNVLLRARAADMTLTGEWSAGTPFQVVTTVNPDSDGDGLPDDWERNHFGNLNQNGSDDFDSDGYSNLAEYCAGTDPRLAESNLTLRITLESDGKLRFEWTGQPIVTLYLEQSSPLESNGTWNLVEKIEPTKPVNVVTRQAEGSETFFRLRLGD